MKSPVIFLETENTSSSFSGFDYVVVSAFLRMACGLGSWHVLVSVWQEKWTVQGDYQSSWSTSCRAEEKGQSASERYVNFRGVAS